MQKRSHSLFNDIFAAFLAWAILKGLQVLFTSVTSLGDLILAFGQEFYTHYDVYSIIISISAPILLRFIQHARLLHRNGRNAEAIGLFYCNMHADESSREQSNQLLRNKGMESTDIIIVGATGYNTFVAKDSPLHDSVRSCKGTVRVILAYPFSEGVARRAEQLNTTPDAYREEIHKTLAYLRDQHFAAACIRIKMYQEAPFWKALFVSDCVWVQQYPPDQHVADAPCFAYFKQMDGNGLYMHHYRRWVRMWNSRRMGAVDLDEGTVSFRYQRADPITLPLWTAPAGPAD
ncbi:hypothetical protein [Pseudodesulfovibrio sp.]|uniref:hypothetical protein n=1 Tax=Pseudodesulfovibrio sp. TaxID=2035812 RepID=UPI002609BBA2|nr:hypothetical protein [Pseudodesulfovibrio sp.]MDD3311306.1 hypothetical protein [Pseudodesulfovibrio sp.]